MASRDAGRDVAERQPNAGRRDLIRRKVSGARASAGSEGVLAPRCHLRVATVRSHGPPHVAEARAQRGPDLGTGVDGGRRARCPPAMRCGEDEVGREQGAGAEGQGAVAVPAGDTPGQMRSGESRVPVQKGRPPCAVPAGDAPRSG